MRDYSDKIKDETGVEFMMRIGINSGPVIVGAIGDDLRMDYTAVGDTTNLGSRMETNALPGQILISENTFKLVKDYFEFDSLGGIDVKGKKYPQEAYELIKTGEIQTRIGASVAKGLTRFVGRKNSMGTLLDAFKKAKAGSGQVIGIVGEAGVGKSRLLLEMRSSLPQDEYIYLEGRCLHYGGSISYLPILDILRSFFDITEGDREFIINKKMKEKILEIEKNLKSAISPFQELLSLNIDDEGFRQIDPKEKREKTFEALRDILIRASHDMPVIIAVEDLHWMDKTSGEFLDYLIGWIANAPVLLMLLYRPEFTHQWGSKSYYSQVGLDQLGLESSGELVKAILEGGDVAPELKNLILNRSAGNPLFIEEFAHSLVENGAIEKHGRTFVLSGKESDIRVPDTIQGIIAARLDRLEDNLKRTMQVASVIGRDFAFRILQTITGMHEELKSQLLNLQGLEFIYEKQLFPDLEYIFKHALTQEVAYNSLLSNRRKVIHNKIGAAIETLYADRLEEFYEMLGYHYSKSGTFEKAYYYFRLSGMKSLNKDSHWEAYNFFREAINCLNQMSDSLENKKRQIEIRKRIHVPIRRLMYPGDSISILEEGARIAEEIDDQKSFILFFSLIGMYHSSSGDPLKSISYQEECFKKASEIEDVDIMAPLADDLTLTYWAMGELSKYADVAKETILLIEKEGREKDYFGRSSCVYTTLLGAYGVGLYMQGDFDEGIKWSKKSVSVAKNNKHTYSLALAEMMLGGFYLTKREGHNAKNHIKNALSFFEDSDASFYLGWAKGCLGKSYLILGDFETALGLLYEGIKIIKSVKTSIGIPLFKNFIGEINFELGRYLEAREFFNQGLELSKKIYDRFSEGYALTWLGRTEYKMNPSRYQKAINSIANGMEIFDKLKIKPEHTCGLMFLGEIYLGNNESRKALENIKKAENRFKDMGMDYWLNKMSYLLREISK